MPASKTSSPLIPESLVRLYRRVAKAFRSPAPPNAVAIARLSRVVELHHRAAAAIKAAIDRSEREQRPQLEDLSREQTRLGHDVGELVTELGGSPPRPDESAAQVPRDPRAMAYARDQAELIAFVHEDLDRVADAWLELVGVGEIPLAIHRRLDALRAGVTAKSSAGLPLVGS